MSAFLNNLFLGYFPYMATAVMIAGLIYRRAVSDRTIEAPSTQLLGEDGPLMKSSILFHYAILLVLAGHIFGLLTPPALYRWLMTDDTKRWLAVGLGSMSGLAALLGITLLLIRRLRNPRVRANSSFQDYFIPLWLIVQIVLGLMGTYHTAHAPLENYRALDEWAQALVCFRPEAWRYIAHADIVYKLHIVNGFLIFILFPYTKLIHLIVAPVRYFFKRNDLY